MWIAEGIRREAKSQLAVEARLISSMGEPPFAYLLTGHILPAGRSIKIRGLIETRQFPD